MFRIWTSVSHVSNDFAYSKFVVCCELLMKSATLNRARCQRLFWCLFQGLGRGLTTNRAWWQRLWWSFLSGLTGGSAPWGTRPGAKILLPDSSMRILSSTAGSFKTTVTVCPSLSISVSSSFTTFSFLFFFFLFLFYLDDFLWYIVFLDFGLKKPGVWFQCTFDNCRRTSGISCPCLLLLLGWYWRSHSIEIG